MNYTKSISEPWFSLIYYKIKKVEGRLNKGDFAKMEVGDTITFTNDNFNKREFKVTIKRKIFYKTFEEYLKQETLKRALPTIETLSDGLSIYYKYFSKEDEKQYGVVSLRISKIE